MNAKRKAVFFDIDGTLIDTVNFKLTMTPAVRGAIEQLREAGHYAFIASGRPYLFLNPELRKGLFDGFVLMNGASVWLHGKNIASHTLAKDKVREILRLVKGTPDIEYVFERGDSVCIRPEFQKFLAFYDSLIIDTSAFTREESDSLAGVCKMEFFSETPGMHGVADQLLALPGLTGVTAWEQRFVELYAANVSKGTGIENVLSALGIDRADSYAFGDGLNDIEMMDTVGHALVMGNGVPELKKHAESVVPPVSADGVAYGILHEILNKK